MNTLSATGPSLGPVVWKLSPGSLLKQLCSRLLAQAYTNGIADAISQEGTDTYGTLD